jgi:hypothetical protein
MTDNDPNSQVRYISIAKIENAIEAQLLQSILTERDIPHQIRSFHDTAYDGLYQFQKGWGEITAPEANQEIIRDILEQIRTDVQNSEQ